MALSDFTIIKRSLLGRLFSTATTVAMVAVSVGLMLSIFIIRDSAWQAFSRGSGNMHLIVSRDSSPLLAVLNGIFYASPPQRAIEWSKYEEIRDRYPLEFAIPIAQGDSYRGFPVLSSRPEFFTQFQPTAGQPWVFNEGRAYESTFEVVIGASTARATGLRLGDRINLTHGIDQSRQGRLLASGGPAGTPHVHDEYDYEVVGILAPTGGPHDRAVFNTLESSWIIHAHDRRVRDLGPNITTALSDLTDADREISGIYLRVITREGRQTSGALQQIFDMLRRDTTIMVASPTDQIQTLFRIVGNIDTMFIIMAGVVLFSSAIAIMLALYNSMEQRRRQIAVLRVLGCSPQRIFSIVMTESALIGLFGVLVGIIVALIGSQLLAGLAHTLLGIVLEPGFALRPTLGVAVLTVAFACLAGIIPATIAYRTPVARHLKPLG